MGYISLLIYLLTYFTYLLWLSCLVFVIIASSAETVVGAVDGLHISTDQQIEGCVLFDFVMLVR